MEAKIKLRLWRLVRKILHISAPSVCSIVAGLDSIGMLVIDAAVRYAKPVEHIVAALLLRKPVGVVFGVCLRIE